VTAAWTHLLSDPVRRNLPSQKPQLWEDLPLTLRRRAQFELGRRFVSGWLDRRQIVTLSNVGFSDGEAPLRLELLPRESMNQSMFLYGLFEIAETRLIQSLLRPGMTFVDIGANIGYYTTIAARIVGQAGRVYSFEPYEPIRAHLETNIRLNRFENVVVRAEAVTNHAGEVSLYPSDWELNQGISTIVPGKAGGKARAVPAIRLDDFADGLGKPRIDVIKMDIEGAEPLAIAGASRTLAASDGPVVIFEAAELEAVAGPLRAHGYHIRRLHYTLREGLELRDPTVPFDDLFASYEAPNYVAAKDEAHLSAVESAANRNRPQALRLLGRI
jgi:FkbM family methyltransferase